MHPKVAIVLLTVVNVEFHGTHMGVYHEVYSWVCEHALINVVLRLPLLAMAMSAHYGGS